MVIPGGLGTLAIEYDGSEHGSSDSSEYQGLPTPQRGEEQYFWDEEEEIPSFVSSGSASSNAREPQRPPGWPPRRLSSEIANQIEVTLLPGSQPQADGYFEEGAMALMQRTSQTEGLAATAEPAPRNTASQGGNLNPNTQRQSSVNTQAIDTHLEFRTDQSDTSVFSSPTASYHSDSDSSGNQPRSSNRLKLKKKLNYRDLASRGRTDQQ